MRKVLLALTLFVGLAGAVHAQPFCPGVTPWVFDDVQASDPFCGSITWAATSNVTLGCQIIDPNRRLFCPDQLVTRKQMVVFMQRLSDYVAPLTCAAGQVMKWNGLAWACANDAVGGGGGTVTSVGTGTGLTGGPITAAGTINLAPSYQLPQSCTNGQVAKSNGSGGWTCQSDANSGGTVTSVATGTGLTGGPITAAGTIGLAATQLLPTVACTNGQVAKWNGTAWACANESAGGTVTSVVTGIGLTGGPITTTGTIDVDTTYIQRRIAASCPANQSIRAIAVDGSVTCETDDVTGPSAFVQNGNNFGAEAVLGTTDAFALNILANNSRVMRYEPNAISPNVIGGFPGNFVTAGVRGATIAGGGVAAGGDPDWGQEGPNRVTDIYGTIGGGYNNRAGDGGLGTVSDSPFATVGGGFGNISSSFATTVAGGDLNEATVTWGTVGGGNNNFAYAQAATVAGGRSNTASGIYSAIPGGYLNAASGDYSVAAGFRAKALHQGSFVWADFSPFDFSSSAVNELAIRATGGARIVLAVDAGGVPTWSCSVISGGSWACSSDRNLKQNLRKLDGQAVLDRVAAMPIYAWNPRGQNAHLLHYGPTAQDFHAAFGLGDSPLRIAQQDADGVALAAIQGVNEKLDQREAALRREIEAKTAEVAELKRQIAELRTTQQAEVAELRRAVEILMARTAADGQLAQAR